MRPCFVLAASLCALAALLTASAQSSAPQVASRIIQRGTHAPVSTMLGAPALTHAAIRPDGTPLPQVAPPKFSVAPGVYSSAQSVSITCDTPGATIYYESNGVPPNTLSPVYSNTPISVSKSLTITAYATAPGYRDSLTTYGNYYITSVPDSFIYNVAGNNFWGFSGDGGLATQADVNNPRGLALDKSGNLYIADSSNNVIREIDALTGVISTIAGTGIAGYSGDDRPALNAQFWDPLSLAFDSFGNLHVADSSNDVIRKIDMSSGVITTVAGDPTATSLGDGGPATSALIVNPVGVAIDSANNLYILSSNRVREVNAKTQIITTVAGGGNPPYGQYGDGGPATSAAINGAQGMALDSVGDIYIADTLDAAIRKVTRSNGIINTVAGIIGQNFQYSGDGGPATNAHLSYPEDVAVDTQGDILVSDSLNWRIRKVDAKTGVINTIAGNGTPCFSYGEDGSPATTAAVCQSVGLVFDKTGNLYYTDWGINEIKRMTPAAAPPSAATAAPVFSVAAGTYSTPQTLILTDSTPGASISVGVGVLLNPNSPTLVTGATGYNGPIPIDGNVTIDAVAVAPGHIPSDTITASYTITQPPSSIITTIAGNGTSGYSGAGGPATSAEIGNAKGIAFDSHENLYIADANNFVVWQVASATGDISLFAGTGRSGSWLGSGPATSTPLTGPYGVAVDKSGDVFIANSYANMVLEVPAGSANIVRYAGNGNSVGFTNGDGGPALSAVVPYPTALAVDNRGNLYIVAGGLVRKVTAATGVISTFAGSLNAISLGDGGPATSARIDPVAITFDSSNNMFIADLSHGRIRTINAKTGIITTIAGNGDIGESGNGLAALDAEVEPYSVAVGSNGDIYFGSTRQVRKIDASTGLISAAVGIGYEGYSGDGGSPLAAATCSDDGLAFDGAGNLYLGDACGSAVRKVTSNVPTFHPPAGTYALARSVTISDAAPHATIYYTTDGSAPTKSSTVYTEPIDVPIGKETIKAISVAAGYEQSSVTAAAYTITQATPTITWATPAAITYGTALSSKQLDATATGVNGTALAGTLVYSPAAGTVLGAGSQVLSVTFTPTNTTDYVTTTKKIYIAVHRATPTIIWTTPAAIVYGTALTAAQLDATSKLAGTFSYSPAAGTVLAAGQHPLRATFTPTDSTDYTTAAKSVTLTVNKATPIITWAAPAPITYGTALSATQLDAKASVPGTFVYSPAAGTVLGAGAQALSVTFTPTNTTDYLTTTKKINLSVHRATPSVSWPAPSPITHGTALSSTQLDATFKGVNGSVLAGTATYNPPAGTVLAVGTHTLSVSFTPTNSTDYLTRTASVQITVK